MKHSWAVILVLIVGMGTLNAQDTDDPRPQRGRRQMQRPGGEGRGMRLQMMAERLAERLNLSPDQRTAYDELVQKFHTQNQAEGGGDQMRELGRQMREARDAGDTARMDELRGQMRAFGESRVETARAFLDEVEPLLDDAQKTQLAEFRTQMEERAQRGNQWAERREMLRALPDQLDLTPEQRTEFDALLENRRATMMERMREQRAAREGIEEELQQAQTAGDEARVAELRTQLEDLQPNWNQEELFASIREILTPEQQTKLAAFQEQMATASTPGANGPGSRLDTQTVLRAAKRLKLEAQQEEQLREIIREAQTSRRAPRASGQSAREAEAEQAGALKAQINAILNADQQAEFEKLLASSGRGGGRGGAGAGRGAPPADGAPAGGRRPPPQRAQRSAAPLPS